MRNLVIIPTYNELDNIRPMIDKVFSLPEKFDLLVIDDGSPDGTAEIVRLADWDTVKSNIFAKTAIRFVQRLPEARLLKSVVVPFEMERLDLI